jgi:Protein kinase domain
VNDNRSADEEKETPATEKAVATPRPTNRTASTVVEYSAAGGAVTATSCAETPPTKKGGAKQTKRMDESAHTFAANTASVSGHHTRQNTETMITDALTDVRVHYHIEAKELGHGHYGIVRKCMHRTTKEWYAIKSIRKSKVSKIEVLKREIEILKEVDHPNIIKLIEVYEDERYLHLITENCLIGSLPRRRAPKVTFRNTTRRPWSGTF